MSEVLTIVDLAARWQLSVDAAQRRIKQLGIPAFNVGPPKHPEWRYRLDAVRAWEAANEHGPEAQAEGQPAPEPAPLRAAPPAAWDGVIRFGKAKQKKKGTK